jgi:hypothetical protein
MDVPVGYPKGELHCGHLLASGIEKIFEQDTK